MKKFGFGTMRLPLLNPEDKGSINYDEVSSMVDVFLEGGFLYFDTAYPYHDCLSEVAVKKCLTERHDRSSYILADKMPILRVTCKEDYERFFTEQLEKTGAGYFDYYLLHNIGVERYPNVQKFGGFEFINEKKKAGLIKQIGFSYHDNAVLLDRILTEHPEVDFVQLQINYLDWTSPVIQSEANYEVCKKHGKPVVVMEPIKGGKLIDLPEEAAKLCKEAGVKPAELALRFAMSLDNVFMVLSGMSNIEQLKENISTDFKELTADEYELVAKIRDIINESKAIGCTSCGYCMEVCPKNINIPGYFGLYNMHATTGNKSNMYYERAFTGHGKSTDCIKCGACEKNCPQHIEIRKNLDLFSKLYENVGQ